MQTAENLPSGGPEIGPDASGKSILLEARVGGERKSVGIPAIK